MKYLRGPSISRRRVLVCLVLALLAFGVVQADVATPISFSPGQVIKASEINANFDALKAGLANPQLANSGLTAGPATAGTLRFNNGQAQIATNTQWTPLVQGDRPYGEFYREGSLDLSSSQPLPLTTANPSAGNGGLAV